MSSDVYINIYERIHMYKSSYTNVHIHSGFSCDAMPETSPFPPGLLGPLGPLMGPCGPTPGLSVALPLDPQWAPLGAINGHSFVK